MQGKWVLAAAIGLALAGCGGGGGDDEALSYWRFWRKIRWYLRRTQLPGDDAG